MLDLSDDDPYVLQALIHYLYNDVLDTSFLRPLAHGAYQHDSAFLIQIYSIGHKYNVPELRTLVTNRLSETCDPENDDADFIGALRVVDECTADNAIWDILLPKVRVNLQTLLKNQVFKDVVMQQSTMTLQLLASLAPSSRGPSPERARSRPSADFENPASKRIKITGAEDGDEYRLLGTSITRSPPADAVRVFQPDSNTPAPSRQYRSTHLGTVYSTHKNASSTGKAPSLFNRPTYTLRRRS